MKYVCGVCGYTYDEDLGDPDNGIEAGTKWEDLPEDFACRFAASAKISSARNNRKSQSEIDRNRQIM